MESQEIKQKANKVDDAWMGSMIYGSKFRLFDWDSLIVIKFDHLKSFPCGHLLYFSVFAILLK